MMTNEIVAGLVVAGLPRQGIGYVDCLNGRSDKFFAWGGGWQVPAAVEE